MAVKVTGILSTLRAVWREINPAPPGASFAEHEHGDMPAQDRAWEVEGAMFRGMTKRDGNGACAGC